MYSILIDPKARKQLRRIDPRYLKPIQSSIDKLANNPLTGKKLESELRNQYSLRVGVYRIIYQLFKEELVVLVIRIDHRGQVYKHL